jgi:putative membrane protein
MWHSGNWGEGFCNGTPFWGFGHGFLGWILPVLFWGLIIWGIVSIIKHFSGRTRNRNAESAMDILNKRYASGEINHQEFSDMKSTLSSR